MDLPHYHENIKLLHVKKMPDRSYYIPAGKFDYSCLDGKNQGGKRPFLLRRQLG